jgi:hypothetical protein
MNMKMENKYVLPRAVGGRVLAEIGYFTFANKAHFKVAQPN